MLFSFFPFIIFLLTAFSSTCPTWMLSTGIGTGGDVEGTDWDALGRTMGRGRVGNAQDAAGLAIFLSSRASAFIVGEVIACDGGILVSG